MKPYVLVILVSFMILGAALKAGADPASASEARGLTVQQQCDGEGRVTATFTWNASKDGQQWVDLSLHDNGFATGTFLGAGPIAAATASFTWQGLLPSLEHYARVNTNEANGWFPSNTLSFLTLNCSGEHAAGIGLLENQIRQRVNASGIDAAVAITDLQTGETASVNGDATHLTGCTINFFVLVQVVRDLSEGRYPESDVGSVIAATIYSSNPVTARDLLLKSRGGDLGAAIYQVNDLMKRMGMTASFYDHPPAYPHESIAGSNNYFTANDLNRALTAFWRGEVTTIPWRDYLLDKMTGVKPGLNYLIPAGVGSGSTSHKNGFFWTPNGWVDNDAGIVTFDRGGRTYAYAVSFFTQGVPVKYDNIPLGQAVSSLAWEYFSNRYP